MTAGVDVQGVHKDAPQLSSFYRLCSYDTLDSTNEEARSLAEAGAKDGTLVWSIMQRAGRGRRGRVWSSPPGNLYVSLILRPDCEAHTAAQLSFVAALAIYHTVCSTLPRSSDRVYLKWPNDVLISGRKVAGILLQSRLQAGHKLDWVVVGTGINIATFPHESERPATSLRSEDCDIDVARALEVYAAAFERYYQLWRTEGFAPIRTSWLEGARGIGEQIEVRLDNETFSGLFEGLDDDGALRVQTADGLRLVTSGDVFLPTTM